MIKSDQNILIPRRLETRNKRYQEYLNKILSQKHIDGDLDLSESPITSLGNIETISGNLYLSFCKNLTSLNNLQSVGKNLDLMYCKKLTSVGSLKSVTGYVDLIGCKKLNIEKLKTVCVGGPVWGPDATNDNDETERILKRFVIM